MERMLWYKKPADLFQWTDALPVGNGRMGAMVFGGIEQERIQLNEESLWSGGFRDRGNPNAKEELSNIRKLLKEKKYEEAEDLARYALSGLPEFQRTYQTLGDVLIEFKGLSGDITGYRRELSLEEGVATTTFKVEGYDVHREVMASYPADVIVVHLSTNHPEGLSFDARIIRNRFCEHSGNTEGQMVFVNGTNGGAEGISFHGLLAGQSIDGQQQVMGEYLIFRKVKKATLWITAATTFRTKDTLETCKGILNKAMEKGYSLVRKEHVKDYQELEQRVSLELKGEDSALPTD